MFQQPITDQEKADLVSFLKSLTDERVRWERAPFDHPALKVPNGYMIDSNQQLQDEWLSLPAIGKNGRSKTQGPLKAFSAHLK